MRPVAYARAARARAAPRGAAILPYVCAEPPRRAPAWVWASRGREPVESPPHCLGERSRCLGTCGAGARVTAWPGCRYARRRRRSASHRTRCGGASGRGSSRRARLAGAGKSRCQTPRRPRAGTGARARRRAARAAGGGPAGREPDAARPARHDARHAGPRAAAGRPGRAHPGTISRALPAPATDAAPARAPWWRRAFRP